MLRTIAVPGSFDAGKYVYIVETQKAGAILIL